MIKHTVRRSINKVTASISGSNYDEDDREPIPSKWETYILAIIILNIVVYAWGFESFSLNKGLKDRIDFLSQVQKDEKYMFDVWKIIQREHIKHKYPLTHKFKD